MSDVSRESHQRALIERAAATVKKLQSENAQLRAAHREPVAIIGMACRFPGGSNDLDAYWDLLDEGRDAIREIPAERWPAGAVDLDELPALRWAGLLEVPDGIDGFDAEFFGITPREAAQLDPQQRLLLEVSWEALEHALQPAERLAAQPVGVFVGLSTADYQHRVLAGPGALDAYSATGNMPSVAAGRLAYTLGLQGPCAAVDTACSSSLVALHLACQSLRSGESALAIAGGVNLILSPTWMRMVGLTQSLSPDGRCKSFDARANGFVRGEGCGVVVLKRLADAQRDGDRVWAVVRGSSINHDGRSGGLTVPNVLSQQTTLRKALEHAGVAAAEIGYVEAHGTGTPIGDPIELEALKAVLGAPRADASPCVVGSVKTNLGHLEAAAGVAGIIKVALALDHERLPAQLHFRGLNPRVSLDESSLVIGAGPRAWPSGGAVRRAVVSSFGISGTNAGVVLEEAPAGLGMSSSVRVVADNPCQPVPTEAAGGPGAGPSAASPDPGPRELLLPLSARSPGALRALARAYAERLGAIERPVDDLAALVRAASTRRSHHAIRQGFVGATPAELAAGLRAFAEQPALPVSAVTGVPRIAMIFPGQGSQWLGMGRELHAREPVFRDAVTAFDAAVRRVAGWSVLDALLGDAALDRVDVIQPAIVAIQLGLAALWRSWGVEPAVVIGQSMGEVAAACVAGALDLDEAARVITVRSRLVRQLRGGAMASVELAASAMAGSAALRDGLGIAAINGPSSTLVAGRSDAVDRLVAEMAERGVFCRKVKVDYASHSPEVEPLREALLAELAPVRGRAPALAIRSTVHGDWIAGELDANYWYRNLREPVQLFPVLSRLLADDGIDVLLEVSPHPILGPVLQAAAAHDGRQARIAASLRRDQPERATLLHTLATLYAAGQPIAFERLAAGPVRWTALPSYPWQRTRHWLPHAATAPAAPVRDVLPPGTRLCSPALRDAAYEVVLDGAALRCFESHRLDGGVIAPASWMLSMIAAALRDLGVRGPIAARDVTFARPLVLTDGETRPVQLILAGGEAGVPSQVQLVVAPREAGAAWTTVLEAAIGEAASEAPRFDAAAACARMAAVPAAAIDALVGAPGATRWVEAMYRGDREIVCRLRAPVDGDHAERFVVHPEPINEALLALVASAGAATDRHAPVAIAGFELRAAAPVAWIAGRVAELERALSVELRLYDAAGGLVAAITGMHCVAASLEASLVAETGLLARDRYELAWEELAVPVGVARDAGAPTWAGPGARDGSSGAPTWAGPGVRDGSSGAPTWAGPGNAARDAGAPTWAGPGTRDGSAGAPTWAGPRTQDGSVGAPTWAGPGTQDAVGAGHAAPDGSTGASTWEAGDAKAVAGSAPARWLILGDAHGICERVARQLEAAGHACVRITRDADLPTELARLAPAVGATPLAGTLFGWGLDAAGATDAAFSLDALDTLRRLRELAGHALGTLWIATRGAVAVATPDGGTPDALDAPAGAALWGLGRVLGREHPEAAPRLVDVDPRASIDDAADQLYRALTAIDPREDQLALRGDRSYGLRLRRRAPDRDRAPVAATVRADASYLITGGLGRLGLAVAEWLVSCGARHLVLTSRSQPSDDAARRIAALTAQGARIVVARADVADLAALRAALAAAEAELPAIRGVIHAAGQARQALITGEPWADYVDVLGAKAAGAWHLHQLTRDRALDFFVMFSSVAGVLGLGGMGSYAAANAYLDALAVHRRARGLPALSIAWGVWERGLDRALGDQASRVGLVPFATGAGLAALGALLASDATHAIAARIDWARYVQDRGGVPPWLHEVAAAPRGKPEAAPTATVAGAASTSALLDTLIGLSEPERVDRLTAHVGGVAAETLGYPRHHVLPRERGLFEIGFDSLLALDLRRRLSRDFGRPFPATLTFDHPTIAQLAAFLATQSVSDDRTSGAPAPVALGIEPARPLDASEPIAIVGIGCRFPGGVVDPDSFWDLLRAGRDATSEAPADRWDTASFDPDPSVPGKFHVRRGGFLTDIAAFDPELFGISPREAERMDPQQRLLLEVTWEALEHAGQPIDALVDSPTGVFVSAAPNQYLSRFADDPRELDAYALTGNLPCTLSGRVSFVLGLRGPNLCLDTGCSGALVALHLACQSLRAGESDLAIAAGVNVLLSTDLMIGLGKTGTLSPDGRCKTFDGAANGFARGEGCGVVVVKRLRDAEASGDRVIAVIRGSAVNHDGRSSGLTVPSGPAQQALMTRALAAAGVRAADVGLVEAHGTGTQLGDPIEVGALAAVYGRASGRTTPCWLGAVKTNLGHLEAAAGAAGLIKAALAVERGEIPPNVNFVAANRELPLDGEPFELPVRLHAWSAARRIAAVSSFGLGGTNAHAVLEASAGGRAGYAAAGRSGTVGDDAGDGAPRPGVLDDGEGRAAHVLTLSARGEAALVGQAARMAAHIAAHPDVGVADIAYSANLRTRLPHRLALAFRSRDELLAQLSAVVDPGATGADPAGVARGIVEPGARPRIGFLFTGQGSQYADMGRDLAASQPVFRDALARCAAVLDAGDQPPLADILADAATIDRTGRAQPALFALQYALTCLWQSWGVEPHAVFGHSVGEIAAACAAGVLALPDALHVIRERARWMDSLPPGGVMVSVRAPVDEVAQAIAPHVAEVAIAAINGPAHVVISGAHDAVLAVAGALRARGVETRQLRVSVAFHSPAVDPILAPFERAIAGVVARPARVPWITGLTGTVLTEVEPGYWSRQIREPVQFVAAMRELAARGCDVLLEIGPHPTLTGLAAEAAPGAFTCVPSLRRDHVDGEVIARSVAQLHAAGAAVDWRAWDRPFARTRYPLPAYAFQRRRLWVETRGRMPAPAAADREASWYARCEWREAPALVATGAASAPTHVAADGSTPIAGAQDLAASGTVATLASALGSSRVAAPGHWLVLADAGGVASALAAVLAARGDTCTLVRPDEVACTADGMARVLDAAGPLRGIVHLWSLDAAPTAALDDASLERAEQLNVASTLALIQALAQRAAARVWLVTRGAVCTGDDAAALALAQAPAWGLGAVIATEHPELWGGAIDLAPIAAAGARPGTAAVASVAVDLRAVAAAGSSAAGGAITAAGSSAAGGAVAAAGSSAAGGAITAAGMHATDELAARAAEILAEITSGAGEDRVAWRGGRRLVARLTQLTPPRPTRATGTSASVAIRPDATYLVTGGHGALGLVVAGWLADRGARHVALVSRRGGDRPELAALIARGVQVETITADLGAPGAVRALLDQLAARGPRLAGIVHAAGVVEDGLISQQTWPACERVLRPKVHAAWALHQASRGLDFVVYFSSASSLLGPHGQASYAAGNAFLDALAHHARAHGVPALAINWGPWQLGMAARIDPATARRTLGAGWDPLSAADGVAVLDRLVGGELAQVAVLPVAWASLDGRARIAPLTRELVAPATVSPGAPPAPRAFSLRDRLTTAAPSERRRLLEDHVRRLVERTLGWTGDAALGAKQRFTEIGMDSLMAIEIRNRLQADLEITLAATTLFNYPTTTTLTELVIERLAATALFTAPADADEAAADPPADAPAPPPAEPDLSEAELIDLIAQKYQSRA